MTTIRATLVEKSSGATTNGTKDLFVITGLVLVRSVVGYVTVAFDGTVTSLNLTHTSTVAPTTVNLCGATVVTSKAIGTVLAYLGTDPTTQLVSTGVATPGVNVAPKMADQFMTAGTIRHKGTAADAGTVLWRLLYEPISVGSGVAAA
jgi:hypothetical protein